ncbi:hypothetical protein LUZ63_013052 [Rhynchospora breviuscula]|uniref:NB-ARC domain-containing protein n=1 Tax=Rhynchospora breviuscula TaxID=2022672 RepID=A0A9Q0C7Z9_9POAL|nr:hypothetical protein LUZ63_013052 [Rhynchospora breviuscula]
MVVISAVAGIGWAISPVLDIVNKKIESYIEKYFQHAGTGEHFEEMKKSLGEIRLIMATVEKQRIEKREEVQYVQKIKDAIYEAEDVVKEFEYKLVENEKFMEQQKLDSVAIVTQPSEKQKSACHTWTKKGKELSENLDWPILGDGEFKKKVKEVSANLGRAKSSAEILLKLMDNNTKIQSFEQENEPPTTSQISDEIVGRKVEREKIIELLFKENNETPTIIQIVGQGGIGKTTLGRLVYNDPRVLTEPEGQGFFDQKMWLSVSENFDGIKLTKEMLKYVSPNFSLSDTSFDSLQKELKEKLASKRILLVLDNLWYVKDVNRKSSFEQNWLQFFAPLKNSTKPGSKIIVTTREAAVETTLESFGSVLEVIELDGLNDADSWSLLKLKAFGRKNQDNRHNLEPIGEEHVKNLKGFPLAIRVVGTELRGKADIQEWKRILNDNVVDKSEILEALTPDYLQPCFAYCSLFPKGYYLKPDRLVHMWIAQEFVHPREKISSEEIGKLYFRELIDRSFIQVIKQENKEYFMMHDLMNDLACHVSQGECYILKEGDTLKNLGSVRHLSVTRELAHLVSICGLDKLRTLILISDYSKVDVADEVFTKMKRIRVLHIDCYLDKLPNIGECKLLQYLFFRNCNSELAPDTFSKLNLLNVLFIRKRLKHLRDTLKLPQSICSMSRLEFIDTNKSILMDIGGHDVHLSKLWRGGSAIFHVQKKEGWELGHLRDFNNIKASSLKIKGLENVASTEEAIEARLGGKEHVTYLELKWDGKSILESNIQHNEILEALTPCTNINKKCDSDK